MARERFDQEVAESLLKVLGHLQAKDGVEPAAKAPGGGQILLLEVSRWNQQVFRRNGYAIQPEDIFDAVLGGRFKPGAGAAAHVQQASRLPVCENFGQSRLRPFLRVT